MRIMLAYLEEGMLTNKLHATASIFCAKNNYGWKDKNETELTGSNGGPVETSLTVSFKKPDAN